MYFHSNAVPLRTHKKSRNGCAACKARRVKCDEAKPLCKKCSIHFSNVIACDYGPNPEVVKKASPKKTTGISPLRNDVPARMRRRCIPPSTKASGVTEGSSDPENVLSITPHHCSTLGGKIDPFSVLPGESSPRVHSLMHHWTTTLALVPTKIHSQYCTNPMWLSAAIANTSLFNITLYACSIHGAGLRGTKESAESIFYKAETIRNLNECLDNPDLALADETLATVLLLTHIVSIIGEPMEVETHIKGLQQMISLRGGIQNYTLGGVFLHMLCTTNHLTAVFSEAPALHPPTCPYTPIKSSTTHCAVSVHESPLLKPFAISSGFHTVMVDLLHDMGYLYAVLDVFTRRFLLHWRGGFENVVANIEQMVAIEDEMGRQSTQREVDRLQFKGV
ncbi:uncharacterized protein K444DRAFT_669583 [Hyaloscypha bicolor E]|uniref:Zn(2)-C6 fungal-type domain-containing protein n=1 Tax=Hyaloscypha bicolor E TaxID=1095630 RepID=A0A2J6SME6_9HELO|nr:uncharacterized protein K444DRAFT_669583 [Hyaloscypha bicolor E]PMD51890.1 hypothetical protein K444DRAFT_669583 [Hyaloscypha bicolor E]